MSYRVTNDSILSARTDAVCVSVEMALNLSDTPVCRQIAAAGGEALRAALAKRRLFLPVGSACLADPCSLPFSRLIMTASPVWLTGKANELLILHRCYESVFALARQSGCESIAMPFLSAMYYRFPQHEAVKIALREAEASALDVLFVADTPELLTLSEEPYRKPAIVSYVGYYRDHACLSLTTASSPASICGRRTWTCRSSPILRPATARATTPSSPACRRPRSNASAGSMRKTTGKLRFNRI